MNKARPQHRINLLDAVDERANLIARSRTSLYRTGKVTAVSGNAVTCSTGGGVVDAIQFVDRPTVAVGQVVLLGTDTDAWWVIGRLS